MYNLSDMHTLISVYITSQDDSPRYPADSSDSVKRQDPPPQPEVSMFGGGEAKESSKPKRRTFEDIREENRRRLQQQQQEQQQTQQSRTDKTGTVYFTGRNALAINT